MVNERQVRERLSSYLNGDEPIDRLYNWLAKESPSIRYQDDSFFLVSSVLNRLEVYFDGFMDERSFQDEARALLMPNLVQELEARLFAQDDPRPQAKPDVIKSSSADGFQQVSFALG